jgi:hypothetical protein
MLPVVTVVMMAIEMMALRLIVRIVLRMKVMTIEIRVMRHDRSRRTQKSSTHSVR